MWGDTRWWPIGRHQCVKCRRRRRSFQSDFKIEGLPKMLECGVRAYLCVAAYVINSAGKHAYSQTAASQQGEGARQLVFLLPLALLCSFCFLLFFVLFFGSNLPALSISIGGVATAANSCLCVCNSLSHHFELFVVVSGRCVAPHHQLGLRAVIAKVTVSLIILEQNLKIKK